MEDDDDGVFKLQGSKEEVGGLIIKKKPAPIENFEFKVPTARTSLLGLDKLAGNYCVPYHDYRENILRFDGSSYCLCVAIFREKTTRT